jgi:hypothetical protein
MRRASDWKRLKSFFYRVGHCGHDFAAIIVYESVVELQGTVMGCRGNGNSEDLHAVSFFFLLKFQFILRSVVIHLGECCGEGVLQCLGERHSAGPLRRW